MNWYWDSLSAFWQMGGYGPFVWGAYLPALALWLAESLLARRRFRRALAESTGAAR